MFIPAFLSIELSHTGIWAACTDMSAYLAQVCASSLSRYISQRRFTMHRLGTSLEDVSREGSSSILPITIGDQTATSLHARTWYAQHELYKASLLIEAQLVEVCYNTAFSNIHNHFIFFPFSMWQSSSSHLKRSLHCSRRGDSDSIGCRGIICIKIYPIYNTVTGGESSPLPVHLFALVVPERAGLDRRVGTCDDGLDDTGRADGWVLSSLVVAGTCRCVVAGADGNDTAGLLLKLQ
jgi:hypothetical protein